MADAEPTIRYTVDAGKPVVEVGGTWTVFSLRGIRRKAEKALQSAGTAKAARVVDASGVKRLDTAGALEILELAGGGPDSEIKTADKAHADLFEVVKKNMCEAPPEQHVNWLAHWLEEVGRNTVNLYHQGVNLAAFFGEIGVLLTAIIVAGRSGSAFTAQIGTMQVNQEVDAMRTIGLNPVEWLVMPRITALVITMPLLAFWGDMTGILGGAVACTFYLDFTFVQFFERMRDTVGPWHFY